MVRHEKNTVFDGKLMEANTGKGEGTRPSLIFCRGAEFTAVSKAHDNVRLHGTILPIVAVAMPVRFDRRSKRIPYEYRELFCVFAPLANTSFKIEIAA